MASSIPPMLVEVPVAVAGGGIMSGESATAFDLPVFEAYGIKNTRLNLAGRFLNLADLAGFFRRTAGRPKGSWYWIAGNLRAGGTRKNADVEALHFLVIDIDKDLTMAEGVRRAKELGHPCVLYTTSNHGLPKPAKDGLPGEPPCDRFRLVFPLARPAFAGNWSATYDALCVYVLGIAANDPACKDASRAWYGAQSAGGVLALCAEGPLLNPECVSVPQEEPGVGQGQAGFAETAGGPGRTRLAGNDAPSVGQLSPCQVMNREMTEVEIVDYLVGFGWHNPHPCAAPPGASSATAVTREGKHAGGGDSATVFTGRNGVRVHIFTSNAPELGSAGDTLTASEVIKRLELLDKRGILARARSWCSERGFDCASGKEDKSDGKNVRITVDDLVEAALRAGLELVRCAGVPYFSFRDARGYKTVGRDDGLEGYLYSIARVRLGWSAGGKAIADAVDKLAMRAKHEGTEMEVALRIFSTSERAYLHLGDAAGTVYGIDADGWWKVEDTAKLPVRFRVTDHSQALPHPVRGFGRPDLSRYLNTDETGLRFAWAFLVGCFLPVGTMPVMWAGGEQGSGKTVGCKALRRLLDPNLSDLAGLHTDLRDLAARLGAHMILAYDNASDLTPQISDALCCIASGVPLSFRKLFRNDGEHVVRARRPIILNGIGSVVERSDLQDRSLPIEFRGLDGVGAARTEAEIWKAFEAESPALLAELLDRVAAAFRNFGRTQVPGPMPRLADLAKWVTASEPTGEVGWFVRDLNECREAQRRTTASENPVLQALISLATDAPGEYTPTNLYRKLSSLGKGADQRPPADWPRSVVGMSNQYKRLAKEIKTSGVCLVDLPRTATRRGYSVTLAGREDDAPLGNSSGGGSVL